jgi:predicted TPR repeat methyltransferase
MKSASKGRSGVTVSPAYFRGLYRTTEDPWNFARSGYESAKYRATLQALPRPRYASALELGCSIGVFTRMLAARCDAVLAVDVSEDALRSAARRCAGMDHVRFAACDLVTQFPSGRFELVTFCELGFYFGVADLRQMCDRIAAALCPGGDLVLVHWTPLVEGHAQTADDVHDFVRRDGRFAHRTAAREPTFRLDVFSRP